MEFVVRSPCWQPERAPRTNYEPRTTNDELTRITREDDDDQNVNRPGTEGGALAKPVEWWHGLRTFLTEVRNELKRVSWPSNKRSMRRPSS